MKRPILRACPCCHADGDENIYFSVETVFTTDSEFDAGYSVRCINCGVSVHDEYSEAVVSLWNGVKTEAEEEQRP